MLGAQTLDELRQHVVGFARRLGFETISATMVTDSVDGRTRFDTVDNTPPEYRPIFEDPNGFATDPVAQHCRVRSSPIVWNQATYVDCGVGERWERMAAYGYKFGVALALHLPQGKHFFIAADRDQSLPDGPKLVEIVSRLSMFALHATEAALKIWPASKPA